MGIYSAPLPYNTAITMSSASRHASAVGKMEGAFFVSRNDLLQWANSLLQVGLTKVEQCASGAVYCQIIDACHPGTVAMRKVNWMSRSDHEFIPNYKVLQLAFDKNHIQKHINVELLIRGRFQDNLEFMQWLKCYWDRSNCPDYDPRPAREGRPLPAWAKPSGRVLRDRNSCSEEMETIVKTKRVIARSPSDSLVGQQCQTSPSSSPVSTTNNSESDNVTKGDPNHALTKSAPSSLRQSTVNSQTIMELKNRLHSQQDELDGLRSTVDGLEAERDYYFGKLREVEILCATQEAQMDPGLTVRRLLEDIQGILYAGGSNSESDVA